jgi:hypothetical protein
MININRSVNFLGKCVLVAIGYLAGLFLAGFLCSLLGFSLSTKGGSGSSFILIFIASMLLGVLLGPYASHLPLSSGQHFILWGSLILFNLGSVIIEGAYFAPDLVSIPIPVLMAQQILATTGAALVITKVFARQGRSTSWQNTLRMRPWYSWIWRFLVSAASYLSFYFVIGGLNYQLVTEPYYASHAGGLTVPPLHTILAVESVRCLFIVFSVFLFLLSARETRSRLMIDTGWLLFAMGGIVPLFWQVGTLPLILLLASAVEIFLQNFSTGVVSALLLGIREERQVETLQAPLRVNAE